VVLPGGAADRVLLVEGTDEMHVIRKLCDQIGFPIDFKIDPKGGKDPLLASIGNEINVSGRAVVGVVIDANNDLDARWQAVRGRLLRAHIDAPVGLDPRGLVIESSPRIGVWLMPDNRQRGQLEDFVASMIPQDDPVWPLARRYVESIPEPGRPKTIIKAQVHAWLAARSEPLPMGTAIKAGEFDTSVPQVDDLIQWLRRLFTQ